MISASANKHKSLQGRLKLDMDTSTCQDISDYSFYKLGDTTLTHWTKGRLWLNAI